MIAGAMVAAFVAWKGEWAWYSVLFASIFGAAASRIVGHMAGKILFPSDTKEEVVVVKAGKAALPSTLAAAFAGATVGTVFAGLLFVYVVCGTPLVGKELAMIAIVPLLVGFLWGVLSALA